MSLILTSELIKTKGVLTFILQGSLDGLTCQQLDQRIEEELDKTVSLLVLDMEQLDYISSAGIRSVLLALKKVKCFGGKIALTKRQPQIVKVFEIMLSLPDLQVFSNQKELDKYLDIMQAKAKINEA